MRLGGSARYAATAMTPDEIQELATWAKDHNLPVITVGSGSNIVWRDEGFSGLVIINSIKGRDVLSQDEDGMTVKVGSGENWDEVVAWTVSKNLSGVETLSLIPGTAGATPVQNVEAYGEQIADSLIEVEVYDTQTQAFQVISKEECNLGYRTSRFKNVDHGRFIICSITLKLRFEQLQPPFHRGLQKYIEANHITDFSPASLRNAVVDIRSHKLPNPNTIANNGSFFKNPMVGQSQFESLLVKFPDILNYPFKDNVVKLSAMWLIEQARFEAGYKDSETGMALWPKHALVVVNEHARTTADLLKFKQKIVDKVYEKFGVTLEQEPELLP